MEDLIILVNRLIKYSSEEEWFEFKENWYDAGGIGEYISSMSNSAAMIGRDAAFLVWGINNDTHELTDTTFYYHVDVKMNH